jgi:FkbM family methyltransferase
LQGLKSCHLTKRFVNLYYWSTVFTKGYGVKAKIRLVPNTIFRVFVYYVIRIIAPSYQLMFNGLIVKSSPKVIVENRNGMFNCRKGSYDIWVTSERFERELTGYFKKMESGVFIDVGANIGRYTIKMARQIGNKGKVIAIEADPENYQALIENIKLNKLDNVFAFNIACWDKEEDIKFFLASINEKGLSSIKEVVSDRVVTVHGNTLDNILKGLGIEKVDMVKIDVEGAEKEVLLGMRDTVARSNSIEILFEAWNEDYYMECRKILEGYGFVVADKKMDDQMYLATRIV